MNHPKNSDERAVRRLATRIRLNATNMVAIQGFGYLGQALSSAEIFATLFSPDGPLRPGVDRFVLSPGHYAIAFYAVAAEIGLIDREELLAYGNDGALLEAISTERTPVLDITCGSLGQGLSGAIGLALAAVYAGDGRNVFAFVSDGEMEEGQLWEAAMFAAHHRIGNLTVVIDANDSQVDGAITSVTTIEPVKDKWRAFGWRVAEVDGHNVSALREAFNTPEEDGKPLVVIARTHILGNMESIPSTADGHFLKLDPDLTSRVLSELEATLD
ncbi:transketolase [Burkholderia sp. WAC0059]|uniref:transketolase n=1 Tax=Burkholderia sp. WAC0059 TaxID=2066022 RepID=UPI000C7F6681|nr:1-deoxy-D-xylulose-5-phosphate synthase N-terminal domain-containing protein [Burkholderia sp. WAC0059]PLZ02429.1 transketolase [Burkholderia sp. WAC0059]